MELLQEIKFFVGAIFLVLGVIVFIFEIIGVFKFKYVLNRMHAAALGDTMGIGLSMIGLILMNGLTFTSLKMLCVIGFLWFSSPTASHLIAELEVSTANDGEKFYSKKKIEKKTEECE